MAAGRDDAGLAAYVMEKPDPRTIPLSPGVYLYKDAQGSVLYVGKARLLRRRVLSYFRADSIPVKTQAMLSHAVSLDFITTTTEKEAFLLEASLIKKYRPHYNILLRDDKQYALFRFDLSADYPRIEIVRHARRDRASYYGPFTSALAARETWKLLHKAFPLRRCTDRAMRNRIRPCLYYHMGQCLAPCTEDVSRDEYHAVADAAAQVLSGRGGEFLAGLRRDMLEASEKLEYEKAARIRDQIYAVEKTVERQSVMLPKGGDMDVIGLYNAESGLALGVLFVRGGAVLGGRSFFWNGLDFGDAGELMYSFLSQFYLEVTPPPRLLLPWIPKDSENEDDKDGAVDADSAYDACEARDDEAQGTVQRLTEKELLEQSLSERRGQAVRLVAPQNADDNRLIDMARSNAREEALQRERALKAGPLVQTARLLHLPGPLSRIECVDVSHSSGKQTRVGLVVYTDGAPDRSQYRTYTMPDSNDDYATLYAWVARRLESGPPWPDLLLIDGGQGQVATVARALKDNGQKGLFPIAGIAKARDERGLADRRAGNVADRIFEEGRSNPAPFKEGSPELLFLQSVRDATHHYAITRHRRARAKQALDGELMRLPGIGTATARLLWKHFPSLDAMQKAGEEELALIQGIGRVRAAKIAECLRTLRGEGAEGSSRSGTGPGTKARAQKNGS